jgi:4-amino-4-deoxychorismate lyase
MSLVNGADSQCISPEDRGLLYGDGLFETFAVRDGTPLAWDRHLRRLAHGCGRLGLPQPDAETLRREAAAACNGLPRGILRLTLTRGIGSRGYRPDPEPVATRIFSTHAWPDYPPDLWRVGINLRFCDTPLSRHPGLAGIKHLNRLEQVLARAEWDDPEVHEGLQSDTRGRVVSGTMSNLFVKIAGRWSTPNLDQSGVTGIIRQSLLDGQAAHGIPIAEQTLERSAVPRVQAAFVTNSVIGIWPVRRLGAQELDPDDDCRRLARYLAAQGVVAPGEIAA